MFGQNLGETVEQTGSNSSNDNRIDNILRILTMLEKALNRLVRRCYYSRSQYPQIVLDVEDMLSELRAWVQGYKNFSFLAGFILLPGLTIKNLADMIEALMVECKPLRGKKEIKKNNGFKSRRPFANQLILC
jgi:hypothetical protein